MTNGFKVAVVGGGLVGALEACLLAKRGFQVTLFEGRHDGRSEPSYYGRSINLAISHRGISALERLSLERVVEECAIPMKARMIHNKNGTTIPIPYDPDGRCINSIERAGLNNFLLNKAEQEFKVNILFNHKLVDMNIEKGELMFRLQNVGEKNDQIGDADRLMRYTFDLIFGCDGSRSSVRSLLARQSQLELAQTYIEHGYLELRIDPSETNSFKMESNYLHIWPRGQYMMIALPNKDFSFTCTLFMPFEILSQLQDKQKAIEFFRCNFPDSIDLIGEEQIKKTLSTIRASSLISIKCKPYNYKNKFVLLGDSAHAMVPFYGQGMNCGFEDCLVLDELFDEHGIGADNLSGLSEALDAYNRIRCPNGQSMCDLAMYNYIEMRDLVNTWSFKMRKRLDNLLYKLFPKKWIPLYTMVTFSRIPINECIELREKQDLILSRVFKSSCLLFGVSIIALSVYQFRKNLF